MTPIKILRAGSIEAHPLSVGAIEEHPSVGLRLSPSATDALAAEAKRLGVSTEELANFSVLYYLADLDSGRIARTIPLRASAPETGLARVSELP